MRAVEWFPLGVAVSTLLERPEIRLPKRTLQRRLEQLVQEGLLAAIGRARQGGLHEGNIARFRLRPSEFQQWKESW